MISHVRSVMTAAALVAAAPAAHALTITWGDNLGGDFTYSAHEAMQSAFPAGMEMRWFSPEPNPAVHPGLYGNLTSNDGPRVQWTFDDITGELIAVSGTDMTPGVTYEDIPSAVPDGDVGLFRNASIFGSPFGILAPIVGSAAGNAYGAATISLGDTDAFTIHIPVMEAQWLGGAATLFGTVSAAATDHGPGVDFACTGRLSGNIRCFAEELLYNDEEYNFVGYTVQWQLTGTVVPVPAAAWLFGSGLMGLIGAMVRRLRT